MSKNAFGKQELLAKIGKKINYSIKNRLLDDIIDLISNVICDEISLNKTVSVNKFGTFYQSHTKRSWKWSHRLQKKVLSRSKRQVKFATHAIFSKLLKNKRKNLIEGFKTKKDDSDKKKR